MVSLVQPKSEYHVARDALETVLAGKSEAYVAKSCLTYPFRENCLHTWFQAVICWPGVKCFCY